jgi:hypothetical protein
MQEKSTIGLGDIVSFNWPDGYDNGTVSQIHKNGTVDVFRPFTHIADFSCSGRHEGSSSVMCYVGIETVRDIDPVRLTLIRKCRPLRYRSRIA